MGSALYNALNLTFICSQSKTAELAVSERQKNMQHQWCEVCVNLTL